jgi:hypothetical protein
VETRFDANFRTKGMASRQSIIDTFTDGTNPNVPFEDISVGVVVLTRDKNGRQPWTDDDVEIWARSVSEHFDCQAFLFGLIRIALGLDSRICRARGLRLVRTVSAPRLLGLWKGSTDVLCYGAGEKRKTINMSTTTIYDHIDKVEKQYYHLRDVDINDCDEPSKKYKTHIIWVPTSDPGVIDHTQGRARLMFE